MNLKKVAEEKYVNTRSSVSFVNSMRRPILRRFMAQTVLKTPTVAKYFNMAKDNVGFADKAVDLMTVLARSILVGVNGWAVVMCLVFCNRLFLRWLSKD